MYEGMKQNLRRGGLKMQGLNSSVFRKQAISQRKLVSMAMINPIPDYQETTTLGHRIKKTDYHKSFTTKLRKGKK